MRQIYLLVFLVFFLIGCGGKSSSSTSSSTQDDDKYGYLFDAYLTGVDYYINESYKGKTENGKFTFTSDDDVIEFALGTIYLGKTVGKVVTTQGLNYDGKDNIINLPMILGLSANQYDDNKSIALGQFLQSLDSDNDPDTNGIEITNSSVTQLQSSSFGFHDFFSQDTNLTELNSTLATLGVTLVSRTKALAHLEKWTNFLLSTQNDILIKPSLLNSFTEIKTRHTIEKKVKIIGNVGAKIYLGEPNATIYNDINFDGNDSNIIYNDTNITIDADGIGEITLDFDNDKKTYFDYFIKTYDIKTSTFSDILTLHIYKDHIPPYVKEPIINVYIDEEQRFLQNIFAFDESNHELYTIISPLENNDSTDGDEFNISDDGTITFKNAPDFDNNYGKTYQVIARTWDQKNMTDVRLYVTLNNILDNPPKLKDQNFSVSIYEDHNISGFVYDLNTTLETDVTIAPDNDANLSSKYFKLHNYEDIFELNTTTGVLTLKDNNNSVMDYEQLPNTIDINFSIENNNSFIHTPPNPAQDTNRTYGILTLDILNKIDTAPKLITPSTLAVNEKESSGVSLITIDKNTTASDKNLDMNFSIVAGNDGNFSIDITSGVITLVGALDFETTPEYNLTIVATNRFNTWYDTNEHNDTIYLTIQINNQIDNPPVIKLVDNNSSIKESTLSGVEIAHFDVNGTIYDANQTTSYTIHEVTKNNTPIGTPPFSINTNGIVTTNRQLLGDYIENIDKNDTIFRLSIKANNTYWDGSTSPDSNLVLFDINITNVIDNIPVIKSDTTSLTIDEDKLEGNLSITFEINGSIYDENNITNYKIISGNYHNLFEVNITDTNGTLRLKENNQTDREAYNALDWETNSTIIMEVVGQNLWYDGSYHNSNPITITINLDNIIEKPPAITCPASLNIPENIDSQTIIGYVVLNSDETDERTIDAMNVSAGDSKNYFEIDLKPTFDLNNSVTEATGVLQIIDEDGVLTTIERSALEYNETNISQNFYTIEINASNDKGFTTCETNITIENSINTNLFVLTVGINLNDKNLTTYDNNTSDNYLENMIFGSSKGELPEYLQIISKNKFSIAKAELDSDGLPNGVMVVDVNKSYADALGSDSKIKLTIQEAIHKLDANFDFNGSIAATKIDKNDDGNITYDEFMFIFIVPENEVKAGVEAVTSLEIKDTQTYTLDGKNIQTRYILIPENDGNTTLGIIAKYFSSAILDFEFDSDTITYNYGNYDLMGEGYTGRIDNNLSGTTPTHPSTYNKQIQGFIYPHILKKGIYQNIYLFNSHKTDRANSYKIYDKNDTNIYYLLENRSNMGTIFPSTYFDDGFKNLGATQTGGLFIWEIKEGTEVKAPIIKKYVASASYEYENDTFKVNILDDNFNDGDRKLTLNIEVK
jgi:hypothetical protein